MLCRLVAVVEASCLSAGRRSGSMRSALPLGAVHMCSASWTSGCPVQPPGRCLFSLVVVVYQKGEEEMSLHIYLLAIACRTTTVVAALYSHPQHSQQHRTCCSGVGGYLCRCCTSSTGVITAWRMALPQPLYVQSSTLACGVVLLYRYGYPDCLAFFLLFCAHPRS